MAYAKVKPEQWPELIRLYYAKYQQILNTYNKTGIKIPPSAPS